MFAIASSTPYGNSISPRTARRERLALKHVLIALGQRLGPDAGALQRRAIVDRDARRTRLAAR